MINVDLSKALHPRLLDVLPAFMPGLFFEICILFGRPQFVQDITGPAHLEHYLEIIVAIILAFILGNAFMLWVRMIQTILALGYRWLRGLWVGVLEYLLRAKGSPPKPSRFASSRFLNLAYQDARFPRSLQDVQRAWGKAATQLLKRRYGIKPPDPIHDEEWGAWTSVLGTRAPAMFKGLVLVMATEATGWSGLAAAYVAPALRSRSYFAFSLFLVFYGVLTDLSVVRRWNGVVSSWLIGLQAVLAEIPQARISEGGQEDKAQDDSAK